MREPAPTTREVIILLAVVLVVAMPIVAASWYTLGWLGVHGDGRLLAAGQTPVIVLVLVWIAALISNSRQR